MDRTVSAVSTGQNPKLGRIRIYPFKSLDPIECRTTHFTSAGSLKKDRRFAFLLPNGTFFNAKNDPRIHRIRLQIDPGFQLYEFSIRGTNNKIQIDLTEGFKNLERWIFTQLKVQVKVTENGDHGFPDDLQASGPTVISRGTIEAIAAWYPNLTPDDIRTRFRANLEIDNVPAFWEDRLCAEKGAGEIEFQIGNATLRGINPCQRCVVPSRNQQTGEPFANFSKHFLVERQKSLPSWAPRSQFNHFYRAAINTTAQNNGDVGSIKLGDEIKPLGRHSTNTAERK
ncbi:MOSC N-terminal beta barrel domain-containing protein [bacterium]|jgi:uncharacterized protein|nr:MOSC domain-containing protein [Verrucomicrobiota bacterium]MDA7632948.1 MOSC N-terminal beta barrel domain-containing protein [bacterium]MDB4745620.1 MOSC N-terminal beta barrel domain-containing protein [Verrucomicrobiota bacterium]